MLAVLPPLAQGISVIQEPARSAPVDRRHDRPGERICRDLTDIGVPTAVTPGASA
jgi:hypothetical protein